MGMYVKRRVLTHRRRNNRNKGLNKSIKSKYPVLSPEELEDIQFNYKIQQRLKRLKKEHLDMLKDEKVEEELHELLKSINSPMSSTDLELNNFKHTINPPEVIKIYDNGIKYEVGKAKNKKTKRKLRKNKKTKKK